MVDEVAAAAAPNRPPRYPPRSATPDDGEGLDLFRTVAPVLVKRYALPFAGALVVLYVLVRLIRR